METASMQAIFEGGFQLVVTCYILGLGIGIVLKVMKMALDK
jgi:hypothetical protein